MAERPRRTSGRRAAAVAVLRAGGLVAFPTETVYGLGADAVEPRGRARGSSASRAAPPTTRSSSTWPRRPRCPGWAAAVPAAAAALAEACWPGPLTLLLRRRADVDATSTGGRDTVGLRVPAHPLALELLRAFDGGSPHRRPTASAGSARRRPPTSAPTSATTST